MIDDLIEERAEILAKITYKKFHRRESNATNNIHGTPLINHNTHPL